MDESAQSLDLDWLEAEAYRTGREKVIQEIRSNARIFGAMAVGATLSVEAIQAASRIDSDVEPFVMLYPGLSLVSCAAIALVSASCLISDFTKLRANRDWKH